MHLPCVLSLITMRTVKTEVSLKGAVCAALGCNRPVKYIVQSSETIGTAVCEEHVGYTDHADWHGLPQNFDKNNLKCHNWIIDEGYMDDNPESKDSYLAEIESEGHRCHHCLWYSTDPDKPCTHDAAVKALEKQNKLATTP